MIVLDHASKANASPDSMIEKEILVDATAYGQELKAMRRTGKGQAVIKFKKQHDRDGFTFNAEDNYYQCTKGVKLTYKRIHFIAGYWMKETPSIETNIKIAVTKLISGL